MIKIKFLLIKTKFYPLYCLYSIKIKNQIFNVFFQIYSYFFFHSSRIWNTDL
ncbi:hypothetical protein [Phthorimaea operculella granulovirus]|uniref:Uncharacterized protein n=1 Tax=Phthorimaea operculella granulovirus TaxID=192584 RepID=Q8JRW8_9BBAC|nr:hypothetical protein [Phthorimaea operculella granulovirus]AAM70289.1 unknown [Phthorimaea operculella granulovirus]ANY57480.1 hypothetical protein PhopGVgp091 [Phthorimaea operculella granulovirus]QBH65926.1 hypothetical protein PhopGVgp091 [Phthorimaea operculella granulovirus]QBH66056.1 hypothetical protein PhopGVgp091 [Phthorimaea operculella granulovirus]QBH66186.1 hypothetical protein PhopGVgp091 [Phthorimaea operculella granulovirus]